MPNHQPARKGECKKDEPPQNAAKISGRFPLVAPPFSQKVHTYAHKDGRNYDAESGRPMSWEETPRKQNAAVAFVPTPPRFKGRASCLYSRIPKPRYGFPGAPHDFDACQVCPS